MYDAPSTDHNEPAWPFPGDPRRPVPASELYLELWYPEVAAYWLDALEFFVDAQFSPKIAVNRVHSVLRTSHWTSKHTKCSLAGWSRILPSKPSGNATVTHSYGPLLVSHTNHQRTVRGRFQHFFQDPKRPNPPFRCTQEVSQPELSRHGVCDQGIFVDAGFPSKMTINEVHQACKTDT